MNPYANQFEVGTPTYRIEYQVKGAHWTPGAWRTDAKLGGGRPTDANLSKWCDAMQASTQPGGCNAMLGATTILAARIVKQSSGAVVASFGTWRS